MAKRTFHASDPGVPELIKRVYLDDEDVTDRCVCVTVANEEPGPRWERPGDVLLLKMDDGIYAVSDDGEFEKELRSGMVRIEFELGRLSLS